MNENEQAKPIIKPTVGRIVLYRDQSMAEGVLRPAIVHHVWSDTCVNVTWFDDNGSHVSTSVVLKDSVPGASMTYEWVPYQMGQAAKTQEALAKVNA